MKFYQLLSVTLLLSITFSLVSNAQSISYNIKIEDKVSERVYIHSQLTLQDNVLYMSPHGPVPERWDDYVENVEITDPSGTAVAFSKKDNEWILDAEAGDIIQLDYEVSITHDAIDWPGGIDGVAFVNDNGYFLTGRSLFILNGQNQTDISVKFQVPSEWKVSTPWKTAQPGYLVEDQESLMESLIMAGVHFNKEISKEDLTINFILSGDQIISQADQFESIAQKTMDYYIKMMGGTPTPGGKDAANIMVTINESDQTDGEVIGGHISILLNPQSPPQQQLVGWFMFAHEFFHLWNGKTLQVSGTTEDWFKEGITNYYTLKALYQIGFINEQALASVFNGLFYQRYQNDSGLGELSMRDAAEGFDKDNHWGLIYGGGLFAGIGLDVMIRENTSNKVSLDDVMRVLYQKYSGSNETYTTEEVQNIIEELTGVIVSDFFQKYIHGANPIPIEKYLRKAGFDATIENGQLLMTTKAEMSDLESQIHRGFLGE